MRFIEPVNPRDASGLVAEVYEDVRRHFGWLRVPVTGRSPFPAHSPAPDLLAAMWSVQFETMLVGRVSRADKEAIAEAVSEINTCGFCADAHAQLGGAADQPATRPELQRWAAATRSPRDPQLTAPPFTPEEAPEVIGTAMLFHYVNRVVDVFLGPEAMLPQLGPLRRPAERVVRRSARPAMRRPKRPGHTLRFVPDAEPRADFAWAQASAPIATSLAGQAAVIEQAGARSLPVAARERVLAVVDRWHGEEPPLGRAWLDDALADDLGDEARAAARLGLLVALAPQRVDDEVVRAYRATHTTDADLVRAVCWSAFQPARRIARWITPAAAPHAHDPHAS